MNSPSVRTLTSVLVVAMLAVSACQRDAISTLAAAAPTAVESPQLRDEDVANAIRRYIAEDGVLRGQDVQVRVSLGIANLTGYVTSLVARERARELAGTIRGARSVVNQIAVHAPVRSDGQIRSDVARELHAELATKARAIGIAVAEGVVTLTGTTDSWPEQGLISGVTKAVPGVRGVENEITFQNAMVRPEAEIVAEVGHRLGNDVWLDGESLAVTARGQGVRLTGVVASFEQKVRAGSDAWVAGVNSVDDSGIVVDWSARDKQRLINDYPLRSDDETARAIRDAFKYDPRLKTLAPNVAVQDGTAVLSGAVATSRARRAAERDAKNTVGVWQVRDEVFVQPDATPTDADIDRVAQRVLSEDVSLPDRASIRVSTSKGKAALSGIVTSGVERVDAVLDVASVPGVIEVIDQLSVQRTRAEVQGAIADRVFWDAMVPRDRVRVSVAPDGVVTLTGTLDSWSEIKAASNDALLGGATRVTNLLKLRGHPEVIAK